MQHLHTKRLPVFYENGCCAYTVVAEDLRFVESLIFARTNTSCSDDNDDDNDEDDDDHDDEDKTTTTTTTTAAAVAAATTTTRTWALFPTE